MLDEPPYTACPELASGRPVRWVVMLQVNKCETCQLGRIPSVIAGGTISIELGFYLFDLLLNALFKSSPNSETLVSLSLIFGL